MDARRNPRSAGILLPVNSLPARYGIGTLGPGARRWVDFLAQAGQTWWQVLPLGPTGFADSPYQSFSAFAGNPYLIDLEELCAEGLLTETECGEFSWENRAGQVDYGLLFMHREKVLRTAVSRMCPGPELDAFRKEHAAWLPDYALFMALKTHMGMRRWTEWDEDTRLRRPGALALWRQTLYDDIEFHSRAQYLFFRQWHKLREYANHRGVRIIGDIPIYVAMDSADTWANRELFLLDAAGCPIEVAGVPPDGFSPDGQLWGNPLYRWDVHRADGYRWWLERLFACMELYDMLRIDHFRGLASYYAVPSGSETAAAGRWRPGPGMDFIDAVNVALGEKALIIAEDLGYLTPEVRALLKDSGYPGMKILQFAFDTREESDYMPHNYTPHCVVYTGTHDNDTVAGWMRTAPARDVRKAMDYFGIRDAGEGPATFIRAALGSVADLVIIPMQDWLGLGSEARLNTPATVGGNWRWRLEPDALTHELSTHIAALTRLYGRRRAGPDCVPL